MTMYTGAAADGEPDRSCLQSGDAGRSASVIGTRNHACPFDRGKEVILWAAAGIDRDMDDRSREAVGLLCLAQAKLALNAACIDVRRRVRHQRRIAGNDEKRQG